MNIRQLFEYYELLLENKKIELIAAKQGNKILKAFRRDRTHDRDIINGIKHYVDGDITKIEEITPEHIIEFLQKVIHKKYVQWIVNRYINREFQLEDWRTIRDDLKDFDKVKNKLELRDINRYKTLMSLVTALHEYKNVDTRSNKQKEKEYKEALFRSGDAKLVYKGSQFKVEVPKTEEAACFLGRGTRWCTAAKNYNMFDHYARQGDLYIITTKSGEKFQFHMESKQFMDESDSQINMSEFIDEYPDILKAIPELEESLSVFDRINLESTSHDEGEEILRDFINQETSYQMYDDNTIVVEEWSSLDGFLRDFDFDGLFRMIGFIEDPMELDYEMNTNREMLSQDLYQFMDDEGFKMVKDFMNREASDRPQQYDMFDFGDDMSTMNELKRNFPEKHKAIVEALVEDMCETSALEMRDYLEKGIKGDAHEHGSTGFLWDTERTHSYGYLLETDPASDFLDSSYGMCLDLYEIMNYITDTGFESLEDWDIKEDIGRYLGEEFNDNPDLKAPEKFFNRTDSKNFNSKIRFILK